MTRNLDRHSNRGQDVTAWGVSDASHPAPIRIDEDGNLYAIQGNAGTDPWKTTLVSPSGTPLQLIDDKLHTSAMPYTYDLALGNVAGKTPWSKIGYAPIAATTETDIWSYGGTVPIIPLITTAATLKLQTNNAADAGTSIFNGTDNGGSTTTLVDTTKDFTAGTPVAAGDCVILEKSGTTPEWGFVSAVTNATTLVIASGFSRSGSALGRTYNIVDYSNQAGAHAVQIVGLDSSWNTQREIVLCAGAGPGYTTTVKLWQRINALRVIAAGANSKPSAAIALMDSGAVPATTYTYISAGYTRARNTHYTIPAGKVLYVFEWNIGYVGTAASKYCRLFTRASQFQFESGEPSFLTRVNNGVNIWYPYTEIVQSSGNISVQFPIPTKLGPTTDIKVSGISDAAGVVTSTLRGWLEDA